MRCVHILIAQNDARRTIGAGKVWIAETKKSERHFPATLRGLQPYLGRWGVVTDPEGGLQPDPERADRPCAQACPL